MKRMFWTIQHPAALARLERTGVLTASEAHMFCAGELAFAGDWMARQMAKRLGPPPEGVRYPVWAWPERRDLRFSGYAPRGTAMVQIAFEAEEGEYLLSDFEDWHMVLNGQYLADSEADWDRFEASGGSQGEICWSWEKIFDLTRHSPGWNRPPEEKAVQATLWRVEAAQVRRVEHFVAK